MDFQLGRPGLKVNLPTSNDSINQKSLSMLNHFWVLVNFWYSQVDNRNSHQHDKGSVAVLTTLWDVTHYHTIVRLAVTPAFISLEIECALVGFGFHYSLMIYFLCIANALYAGMYVYHVCTCACTYVQVLCKCLWKPESIFRSPGPGVWMIVNRHMGARNSILAPPKSNAWS